ncbi:V-type ATPase subunit [Candidatus Bathyarchaeota archaeon]|nr:MAG: V-type ATPase subunit [Candidatus Bathyarchaeota archaeon]
METETLSHIVGDNYIIARIRGEKGKLLERQQIHSLAEFRTQSEILGVLAEGPYGKELSELKEGSSPIETERAVRLGFARGVKTLISSSQGPARDFLLEFSRRFDAYDLAAIVVFKAQGKTWEEFVSTRQPLALLKEAELHRLYSMDDLRTIVGIVGDRALVNRVKGFSMEDLVGEKASLVRDIITAWGEERFYNYVNDKLGGFDRESCLPIVGGTVDLANLIIILRSKLIGIPSVREHLISSSWKLDDRTIDQLLVAQDVTQALDLASSHPYYHRILSGARQKHEETKSLSFLEVASRKHSIHMSKRIFLGFPYTLGIVLAFLVMKENEARNLAAIVAGVGAGMKPDQIRSLVAIPD